MNKVYKVIWSEVRNCYIVVSELAKRHSKGKGVHIPGTGLIASALVVGSLLGVPGTAFAETVATDVDVMKIVLEESSQAIMGPGAILPRNVGIVMPMMLAGTREIPMEPHFFSWNVEGAPLSGGVSVGNYNNEGAKGKGDVVIGPGASTSGADGKGNVVIGNMAQTGEFTRGTASNYSVAIGQYASAKGEAALAIGGGSPPPGMGNRLYEPAFADGSKAIAVGGAKAVGEAAIAMGYKAETAAHDSISIGREAKTEKSSSTALGTLAEATGELSTALGFDSHALGKWSIAMGQQSKAKAQDSMAFGQYSQVTENAKYGVAIGNHATVDTPDSSTYNYDAVAIGASSHAQGDRSLALGASNYSTTPGSAPTGAIGNYSLAMMYGSKALKEKAIAIGYFSKVDSSGGTSIGRDSYVGTAAADGIALGADSIVNRAKGATGAYLKPENDTSAKWVSTAAPLSIGAVKGETSNWPNLPARKDQTRQIINVAAGTEDTDAVNVAQLKALQSTVPDSIHYFSVKADDSAAPDGTNWNNDGAKGEKSIAIGSNAISRAKGSLALGLGAETGSDTIALPQQHADDSIAIGTGAKAKGFESIAIGKKTISEGFSVVIGSEAKTDTTDPKESVVIGRQAVAKSGNTVVIGGQANSEGNNGVAIGTQSSVKQHAGVAIGGVGSLYVPVAVPAGTPQQGAVTLKQNGVALGSQARAAGDSAIAIGLVSHAAEDKALAIGELSYAGSHANATGASSRALGLSSIATGTRTLAVGPGGVALGANAVSLVTPYVKNGVIQNYDGGVSIGRASFSAGNGAALGRSASANGYGSTALGAHAKIADPAITDTFVQNKLDTDAAFKNKIETQYASELGKFLDGVADEQKRKKAMLLGLAREYLYQEKAQMEGTAVGFYTNVSAQRSVALGARSVADRPGHKTETIAPFSEVDLNGKTYGAVSVGGKGWLRQIINVGDGTEDTDAVNLRQLRAVADTAGADMYFHVNPGTATDPVATNKGPMTATAGAGGKNSLAAGVNATTAKTAQEAIAIGYKTQALGNYSVAVGPENTAGVGTTSIVGNHSSVTGTLSGMGQIAMMGSSNVLKDASRIVMLGSQNKLTGNATKNEANKSVLIGAGNEVNQNAGNTIQYFKHTTLIGTENKNIENPENSIIMGNRNTVKGTGTENILFRTRSKLADSILLGESNTMIDTRRVGVIGGVNEAENSYNSSVIGIKNKLKNASASNIIGIDNEVSMDTAPATFLGDATNDVQNNVIGVRNKILNASKQNSIIGSDNALKGESKQNFVGGFGNTLGENLVGNQILASKAIVKENISDGVLIGQGGSLEVSGGVALGSNSVAKTDKDVAGYDPLTGEASTDVTATWKATEAAVSVGGGDIDPTGAAATKVTRQITNVAAGTEDTDAVNVAQLKRLSNQVIENKTHYYSVNTNPPIPELPNYNNDGAEAVLGLAAGASVKTKGIASTATGTFLRIEGNGDALKFQGATASTYGAFNKIGAKDGVKYDGVANSVIGVANMTENANAALIFGAGNKITNSYRPVTGVEENEAKAALIAAAGGDNSAMIELLQNAVKESGGAVLAVGGANMADYAQLSKLVGVGNKLSGTENEISAYNMIDGYLNEASNVNHLTMIGTGNNVTNGEYNIVIGDGRKLTGASSQDKIKNNIILGSSTGDALLETTVSDVVVIGNNANATVAGGIALGSGSIADTGAGKTGFDVAGGDHANDTTGVWKATAAAVSIGTAADPTGQERITRQITNVAAGTEETDAVNVAQLKAVSASLADKGLDFQGDDGVAIHKDLGETLDIVGGADPEKLTDNNIGVVHEDGQLVVKLAQNIDLTAAGSVTIGDTVVNNDGLTINGGPTITKTNVTMGGQQIHNVAAGTEETDAVNVSQLNTAVAGATTEVKAGNNIAVAKTIADDGHIVYTVHGKDTTVSTSDTSLTVTAEDKGNGLTNYDIKLNNVVTVGNAPATQVQIDGTTGTVNGLTNKTWDPDNITSGQAATEDQLQSVSASFSNKGLDFQGDDGTAVHKNLGETLNIVGGADPAKLTNNNIGVVHEDGQLVVKLAKNVNLGADGSVTTGNTTINNNGLTINNGPSVTNEGINAGNKKITNVAAGTIAPDSTDAVNGSQLYDTNQMITNIGDNINRLGDRVDKVGAGAAALAAMHPLDFDPDDKWNISAGYGNYKGSHAGAVGAFYRPDENTMFSIGASLGNGENMINAGVTIALDRKSRITTSRTAMAREIMDLRKEITELKASRANGNWMLDPEMTKLFPDVPENHWAYEYVAKLAGNGIIEGYPDGNFAGNRMMTRYEFAALLYRAMEKGANVDARALKEFAPEMGRIRVDRVYGKDNDRNKVERVRVNNENAQERDRYGSKIQAAAK